MKNKFNITSLSLEATVEETTVEEETEATVYALIGNVDGLAKADYKELHNQAETKLNDESKIRVRKTTRDGIVKFEQTIKDKVSSTALAKTVTETTCVIPEGMFNTFFKSADKKSVKTRYVFKDEKSIARVEGKEEVIILPGLKYEVDVFTNKEGKESTWCKIDIELDSTLAFLKENHPDIEAKIIFDISRLPFNPQQPFEKRTANAEQLSLIDGLYDTEFKY